MVKHPRNPRPGGQPGTQPTSDYRDSSLGAAKKYTSRRADLQLVNVEDALGHTTRFEYDPSTRVLSAVEASPGQGGKLIARSDPNGHVTTYTYDENGNLQTMTDPAGATTTLTYDNQHNPTQASNALGSSMNLAYDANHRLISKTNPNGQVPDTNTTPKGSCKKKSVHAVA